MRGKDRRRRRVQEKVQEPKERERDILTEELGTTPQRESRGTKVNVGIAAKLVTKGVNAERRFKPSGAGKRLAKGNLNRGKRIRFASGGPLSGFHLSRRERLN